LFRLWPVAGPDPDLPLRRCSTLKARELVLLRDPDNAEQYQDDDVDMHSDVDNKIEATARRSPLSTAAIR
jgi:hypothetical protein